MRRFVVALVLTAGCRGHAPRAAAKEGPAGDAGPHTRAIALPAPVDAAPEIDAEPIRAPDVLVGPAAERAIAAQKSEDDPDEDAGEAERWQGIRPDGLGPLRLRMSRADVVRILEVPGALHRVPGPASAPIVERALLPGDDGKPYLEVRVSAGRLESLDVIAADRRALTDRGIGVGTTFEDAETAHGPARRVDDAHTGAPRGFVLADLPGVIFVPADATTMHDDAPAAADHIARITIVGPEQTAPSD